MKASELRKKSVDELRNEVVALLKELFNLRMQKGLGQKPLLHMFKRIRRDVARVKTILTEKEGSSV